MRAATNETPADAAGTAPPPVPPPARGRGARALPWLLLALWIGVLAVAVPMAARLR